MKNVPAGQRDRDTPPLIYRGGCPGSPKRIFHTQNTLPFMHPNRKTNRPQNPPLTRRQLDQLVGRAITDYLRLDPRTHYEDAAAQSLIEDVLALLPPQPDY